MGFQEAIRLDARTMTLRGTITFATGAERAFAGEDVARVTVDEGVDDGMLIGAVLSAKYTMELVGTQGAWLPGGAKLGNRTLIGATVQMELGAKDASGAFAYAPFGCFVVEEACADTDAPKVTLKGYDSLYSETADAFADTLSYPATLGSVFAHILENTRYTFSGQIPNGSRQIAKKPNWGEISVRQAMAYALTLAGAFARVDREGTFEVRPAYDAGQQAVTVPQAEWLRREYGYDTFGPLNALIAQTAGAADGSGEVYGISARVDAQAAEHSRNTIRLSNNPLLLSDSAQAVLDGMLEQVGGMTLAQAAFRFRGDPTIEIGDVIAVGDTTSRLTRQKMEFGIGFSAECELGAPGAAKNTLRAITPEGGLNAGRLVGCVDGGLIKAESVTARAIAAGSVTAEKIAAGAVDAEAIRAVRAQLQRVYAENLETDALYAALADVAAMRVGAIEVGNTETDELYAGLGEVMCLRAEQAALSTATADRLHAAVAEIADLRVASTDIGFAQIKDLVSGTAIITEGVGGKLMISRLAVTEANMVNLTVGELVVKGSDGNFYTFVVDGNGTVTTQKKEIVGDNIAQATIPAGKLLENTITTRELNAEEIFADSATVRELIAANLDVGTLFAREAMIQALNTADISANGSLTLFVRAATLETYLRLNAAGVEVGKTGSASNVRIDDDSVDVVNTGVTTASFSGEKTWCKAFEAETYVQIGNYFIRRAADGGVAFGV